MGTSLRTILFDIGGGVPGGGEFKAAQTGGPSGGCIPAEHLDTPVDYESLQKIGSIMGSGGLIVMDDTSCMVDVARYFMEFCMDESLRQVHSLPRGHGADARHSGPHHQGRGRPRPTSNCSSSSRGLLREASLCGLGQTAPNPVMSTLRYFRRRVRRAHPRSPLSRRATARSTAGKEAANERQDTRDRRQDGHRPGRRRPSSAWPGTTASRSRGCATWAASPTSAPAGCAWSRSKASGSCRRPA